MVKKVIGAVLVMMVLFSGSVWARGSNDPVSASELYTVKMEMDTSVLFTWWLWSMAVQSRDTERVTYALSLLEQAMTGAAIVDEAIQSGGYLSASSYGELRSCSKYVNMGGIYLYRGKSKSVAKMFSKVAKKVAKLPPPAPTNTMFVVLNYVKAYTYTKIGIAIGFTPSGPCDDGNPCTQNDAWTNGQCVGQQPLSPIYPGC